MFRSIIWIAFSLAIVSSARCQLPISDSIKVALKEKPKTFVSLHNRNTFIRSNQTKLYGLVGGLDYNKKFKIFIGLYGFGRENKTELINSPDFVQDTVVRYLSTNNLSIGAEYTYFSKGRIRISWPIQVGFGGMYQEFFSRNSLISNKDFALFPIETGSNAHFELLPWTGLKAGVGYRFSLGNKEVLKLTSPFYNLGLSIQIGELLKQIKN